MPILCEMKTRRPRDLYTGLSRSRMRLGIAFPLFALVIMLMSGALIFALLRLLDTNISFWLFLVIFWLLYTLYAVMRYAIGGRWMFMNLERISRPNLDRRLSNALDSMVLASGFARKIRLMLIPSLDINSFSLSLPDSSFVIVCTQGLADKVPPCEREAVIAHEMAHIIAGDAIIYTIMIRMCGNRAFRHLFKGAARRSLSVQGMAVLLVASFAAVAGFLVFLSGKWNDPEVGLDLPLLDLWLLAVLLFIAFCALLPFIMHRCFKLVLGKEREYHADLRAVYLVRDPGAVHGALKHALGDVSDLLLLSSYLDPLLFHPVVDFSSYRPFHTQPTMMQRMRRLEVIFPLLETVT